MSLGLVLLAAGVGGATYVYAKSKQASDGTAAVAGVATGAGTALTAWVVAWMLPILVLLTIIGVPAAGAYYYLNKDKSRKALGPGRDY
jgi:hypothetical protein